MSPNIALPVARAEVPGRPKWMTRVFAVSMARIALRTTSEEQLTGEPVEAKIRAAGPLRWA
jgi:hypothetical protein